MTFLSGLPLLFGDYFVSGDAIRVILPIAGIVCMVTASFLVWKAENEARLKAEALVYHPFIDIGQSFLCFDPPQHEAWRAKIKPTKTVNAQVCLDCSAYVGGIGDNFWGAKQRLVLKRDVNFVKGAEVSIDLIRLDNSSPTRFWRWATANGDEWLLMSITCYRCQLVFIDKQGLALDYFDFFVSFHYEEKPPPVRDGKTPTRYEKMPSLIGENQFLYAREWKNIEAVG